jgi:hypothetical protein
MNTKLNKEVTDFIVNTSNKVILSNFNDNNKSNIIINFQNDNYIIEIRRNCFPDTSLPYYEDYRVSFQTNIENKKIDTTFYLEWKNNKIYTELIPCNTISNFRGIF